MFVQGYVTAFLRLYDLGDEERHKAITRNCAPQGRGHVHGICILVALLSLHWCRLFASTGDLL